jgi:hypothetical protein
VTAENETIFIIAVFSPLWDPYLLALPSTRAAPLRGSAVERWYCRGESATALFLLPGPAAQHDRHLLLIHVLLVLLHRVKGQPGSGRHLIHDKDEKPNNLIFFILTTSTGLSLDSK